MQGFSNVYVCDGHYDKHVTKCLQNNHMSKTTPMQHYFNGLDVNNIFPGVAQHLLSLCAWSLGIHKHRHSVPLSKLHNILGLLCVILPNQQTLSCRQQEHHKMIL